MAGASFASREVIEISPQVCKVSDKIYYLDTEVKLVDSPKVRAHPREVLA